MLRKLGCGCVCAAVLCWVGVSQAPADVLIGNFSAGVGTGTVFGPGSTTVYKAFGWRMPAGEDYFLDAAKLTMRFTSLGDAEVSIWDGATLPENKLVVLDSPQQVGSGDFAFTPPAPFILYANQNYWVYIQARTGSPQFYWEGTSPSTMPSGMATAIGYIFNGSPSSYYNRLQIEGTIVPEPAGLMLLALAGLWLRRR